MSIQIYREINADVVKRNATKIVYAKQHDVNTRFLKVRIQEDGKDIKVDPELHVILNVLRSDNQSNMFYGTVNEDGTVRVPLASWVLELSGNLVCDISIISDDPEVAKLTTMQFNIYVEEAAVPDDSVIDTEEYSVIVDLLSRTSAMEKKVSDLYDEIRTALDNGTLDGKSVYDFAKEAGYTGTEEEFAEEMALLGETGQNMSALMEHAANKENPHEITPEQIGAVPIIYATSADYDMDEVFKSGPHCAFYHTSSITLGTPYKQGITDSNSCMILSYASPIGYGHQIAFSKDSSTIFIRILSEHEYISQWEESGSGFKRVLTAKDDLNNIKGPGTYLYYTGDVPQNCPYENAGIVEVVKGDAGATRVIQRVTRYGTAGCSSFRALQDDSWREWAEFATVGKTLSMHIVTTKNTDLNDYRTTGIYYFSQSYAPTNIPVGVNGWLQVMTDGHTVKQIWYRYGSADNHHNTFVRTYTGTAWQDWYQYCIMQVKTVTGTTNSNGNIQLGLNSNYIILSLRCQDQIATPYYYGVEWRAHIANAGTGAAITNTQLSVVCWYAYAADWINA